jgi:peptidylprolyl isomerase/peptidyl-prolyl cis-trans isomerase B (cyclophilin B)
VSYQREGFQRLAVADERRTSFDAPEQVLEEGRDYLAVLETSKGRMVLDLYPSSAPVTVNNFVFLALNRYYDGIVFHRVLEDFMAQTGDPTGTGRGGPGYQFGDEFDPELTHDGPGVLSMANAGPGTNGSQFFITFVPTPWLDGRHAIFGRITEGLEVLDALTRIDPSRGGDTQPDQIDEAYILASG